jgi:hypothetical protein
MVAANMYKKLPVHSLLKGCSPHQVYCILIGNSSTNGNFSYVRHDTQKPKGTKLIKDGQRIRVNGTEGNVEIL